MPGKARPDQLDAGELNDARCSRALRQRLSPGPHDWLNKCQPERATLSPRYKALSACRRVKAWLRPRPHPPSRPPTPYHAARLLLFRPDWPNVAETNDGIGELISVRTEGILPPCCPKAAHKPAHRLRRSGTSASLRLALVTNANAGRLSESQSFLADRSTSRSDGLAPVPSAKGVPRCAMSHIVRAHGHGHFHAWPRCTRHRSQQSTARDIAVMPGATGPQRHLNDVIASHNSSLFYTIAFSSRAMLWM